MQVPSEQEWLFWDVDPAEVSLDRDRRYVLARVLERGRLTDVKWAISCYGIDGVREFFMAGAPPEVSRATRGLWQAFFERGNNQWLDDVPTWRNNPVAPWID